MEYNKVFVKIKLLTLLLALWLIPSQQVFANSGPTFWKGYPLSEVLIDKTCPVEVEAENLVFDLRGESRGSWTINGQVTAAYRMVNPTEKTVSVQMAFPFISTLYDFPANDIAITADGTVLPYDMYIGDVVNNYGNSRQEEKSTSVAFEEIVSTITSQPFQAEHFLEDEKGQLYTIEVKPTTEQRINLAVDFEVDHGKSKVLTSGVNGYQRDHQKVRVSAWCYEPEIFEIFVLGDPIDFRISGYTDGALKEETSLFTAQISTEETELKPYFMDTVNKYLKTRDYPSLAELQDWQLYNLYAASLDRVFTSNEGFGSFDELMDLNQFERILIMVYTVDFQADSKRDISVSYNARGTMDKTKTVEPVYTFDYLLNPAENWSSYRNLTIEVRTPEEAPYIIDSNLELTKVSDRYYTTSLESLPNSDFVFSIYSNEKITASDKAYSTLKNTLGYVLPLAIVGGFILIVVTVGVVLGRHLKKHYRKKTGVY